MKATNTSLLIVENDLNLRNMLIECTKKANYTVHGTQSSIEGLELFKKFDIDLCIIDSDLPDINGFALAAQIRMLNNDVPIIFMMNKNMHTAMLRDFDYDMDDYIAKPFNNEELLLRIRAVLRRMSRNNPFNYSLGDFKIPIGQFIFDTKNMTLKSDDKDQQLTRKEAALLKVLYDNKNELLTRKKALKTIWGNSDYFIGRSMDVFIARLRKYLKSDPSIKIVTIHGVGFRLVIGDEVLTE